MYVLYVLYVCLYFYLFVVIYLGHFGGEMSELDDAGTYYDLGLARVTSRGTYYYLSTRNNNFTNRSQKGKIIAYINALFSKRIGWNGGTISTSS